MSRPGLTFQKGDLLAILMVAAAALGVGTVFSFQFAKTEAAVVQISQNGELMREVPLDTDQIIEIDGKYHNVLEIRDGRAMIRESDCPGRDCVHSGWIDSVGRSIICLPNRVEIRIIGTENEVDFVVE